MKVKDKFLKARKKYSDSKKWAIFLILTIFTKLLRSNNNVYYCQFTYIFI